MFVCCWVAASWVALAQPAAVDDQTAIQIEALSRLKEVNLEENAALKGAVLRVLEKTRGTPQFVELVSDFRLKGHGEALLEFALKYPAETSGIEAFRLAMGELGDGRLDQLLSGKDATTVVQLMGNSNDKRWQDILESFDR